MHIVYYDESGDDEFPSYASPLFVLSAVYCPSSDWRDIYEKIAAFKHGLISSHGLPFKFELHTRELILNKKPYSSLNLDEATRLDIITNYTKIVSGLNIRAINVAVIKPFLKSSQFDVLDKALSYSVNRIETDMKTSPDNHFLIITDEGRVGKMRSTTRRMQKINYIPSHFEQNSYRNEVRKLIEDPLPKNSKESYFIQIADMMACLFYLATGLDTGTVSLPARSPSGLTQTLLNCWLNNLKPILNLKANSSHPYGLVKIPK